MALKTILVCLNSAEHAATILKLAVPLARRHDAHLIGLHTIAALVVYPSIAMHVPGHVYTQFRENQKQLTAEIKAVFETHTKVEDFVHEFRLLRTENTSAADGIIESARTADIVIMSHEDRQWDRADQSLAQDRVIRECGRPVIVVPANYDGPEIGSNIVLGWSDTREAARAAHDMTDLATPGAEVTILRLGSREPDEFSDYNANALAGNFDRHGLKATIQHHETGGKGIAAGFNEVAFDTGADLIVTGAFGHSRVYDFVIGAASHDLLRHSKLPVLFSK